MKIVDSEGLIRKRLRHMWVSREYWVMQVRGFPKGALRIIRNTEAVHSLTITSPHVIKQVGPSRADENRVSNAKYNRLHPRQSKWERVLVRVSYAGLGRIQGFKINTAEHNSLVREHTGVAQQRTKRPPRMQRTAVQTCKAGSRPTRSFMKIIRHS